jgi:hypothetical protein
VRLIPWLGGLALLLPVVAAGHVGPSPDVNNRYLKLSPLADGIRLVYTVYVGEQPGRAFRRRGDRDGDGAIGEAEARRLGEELGAEVAAALRVELDGAPVPLVWREVEVGVGDPRIEGGSLAIDLVAWLCFAGPPGGRHELVLRDGYVLPTPGESELRVEESPGVVVRAAGLGAAASGARDLDLRWRGAGQPTARDGYRVELEVDPELAMRGGVCGAEAESSAGHRWWAVAGLLIVGVLVVAGLLRARARARARGA